MRTLIDANVLLRYLLDDNKEMSLAAELVIEGGAYTLPEIICEVIYVLEGVYRIPREKISSGVLSLFNVVAIEHINVVIRALLIYQNIKLDFVDCLLAARHQINGENIFTFDKKLNKFMNQ